jgi:hypothetical protein
MSEAAPTLEEISSQLREEYHSKTGRELPPPPPPQVRRIPAWVPAVPLVVGLFAIVAFPFLFAVPGQRDTQTSQRDSGPGLVQLKERLLALENRLNVTALAVETSRLRASLPGPHSTPPSPGGATTGPGGYNADAAPGPPSFQTGCSGKEEGLLELPLGRRSRVLHLHDPETDLDGYFPLAEDVEWMLDGNPLPPRERRKLKGMFSALLTLKYGRVVKVQLKRTPKDKGKGKDTD